MGEELEEIEEVYQKKVNTFSKDDFKEYKK